MNKSMRQHLQELIDTPWCLKPLSTVSWHFDICDTPVMEQDDPEILEAVLWLYQIFSYIREYPRPSSVARHLDQIRQHVECLALKSYQGE